MEKRMPGESEDYVPLKGGLTVPVASVFLLFDLERRGFRLSRCGPDIAIRPFDQLTDADRRELRRWKDHVLSLLDYVPPEL
jgi:hypothetical protein